VDESQAGNKFTEALVAVMLNRLCKGTVPCITLPDASYANKVTCVPDGTELIFRVFVVVSDVAVRLPPCINPDDVIAPAVSPLIPVSDLLLRSTLDSAPVYGTNSDARVCPSIVMLVTLRESSPFSVLGKTVLLTPLRDIPCYY
jgi:hypothetical protein